MATNRHYVASWSLACVVLVAATRLEAQPSEQHQVTVISEIGIDSIPVSEFAGVPMIPLDAVARLVDAEVRPAPEQGVTLSGNGKQARISDGRNFVPVEGRLVLLQSPARRVSGGGEQWFVPLDFLTKVLPSFAVEPVLYRDQERMLVIGDAFPTLAVSASQDPNFTRVDVTTSLEVPIEVSQSRDAVLLTIGTPFLHTEFRGEEVLDEVVQRITLRRDERSYELKVTLGPRFWNLRATKKTPPEHGMILDLLRSRVPTTQAGRGVETIEEDLRSIEERGESPAEPEAPAEEVTEIVLPPEYTGAPAPPPDILDREPSGPARLRIVALDPGHGGAETGAEGRNGLAEKDVVLEIARRLRSLLQDRLGLRVILTRDGDRNLALDDRAAVANSNKADVFISIHADASPSREARGSSVYFLSYSSSQAAAQQVSSARSRAPASGDDGLDFILWDMAQASHLSQSSRLAEIFQEELLSATGSEKINRGIKQNTFRVLKGATMPAVLVEVGFISNPDEEELLTSEAYQDTLAEALYRGILRFKDVYEYQPTANAAPEGRH